MKNQTLRSICRAIAAVMLAPALLSAETWDLAKDFSPDKNPNGPWQYGYSTYGGMTLTPLPAAKDILALPGLNGWSSEGMPFIAKNTTGEVISGSGFEVAPGEVVLRPGHAPADSIAASAPVGPSPLALRIGLGFEDESRCFNGSISGFRIWSRALNETKPEVTPEQKFEALATVAFGVETPSATTAYVKTPMTCEH